MYYPYVFEYAIKAGLIKDGRLVEPIVPMLIDLRVLFAKLHQPFIESGVPCAWRGLASMITDRIEVYLKGSNMNAARLEDLHLWEMERNTFPERE
ncbi:Uncharacterised protein [uncultured archaeon]|nr:Uncharacterised protein [uncultured archaeon]